MEGTLAPRITVNALALGAILPPSDGTPTKVNLEQIPRADGLTWMRWDKL